MTGFRDLFRWLFLGINLVLPCGGTAAERMLEIELDGRKMIGAVVAHNPETAWFEERDGRLTAIRMADVADYQVLGTFRTFSSVELREQLAREFGRGYSVTSTGHYLVVSAAGTAGSFANLFEQLYRDFVVTFAARGFRIQEPDLPLVAVVFPDEARFLEYCAAEGVKPRPGLRGYYMPSSNRVALYDAAGSGQVAGSLDDTIVHEAVHQVAFNTGIHSRIGENPLWAVEGLATAFEVAAVRSSQRLTEAYDRMNRSRFQWFQSRRNEWKPGFLARLVSDDGEFTTSALDAYAQAWALTFYLLETRSADYTAWLRHLARRDPLATYTAEERLREFQRYFGNDLALLEARLLRFYDDLSFAADLARD